MNVPSSAYPNRPRMRNNTAHSFQDRRIHAIHVVCNGVLVCTRPAFVAPEAVRPLALPLSSASSSGRETLTRNIQRQGSGEVSVSRRHPHMFTSDLLTHTHYISVLLWSARIGKCHILYFTMLSVKDRLVPTLAFEARQNVPAADSCSKGL